MATELRRQLPLDGGVAPGIGGFGFPGFGGGFSKNLDVDVGGGFGFPGFLGGGGGGFPGWGGPYIPITPLGALGGIKGDLLVPVVAIGVALFLLVLIVMAVKMALAWKLSFLEDLSGPKKWRRDTAAAPQLENDYMIQLAKVVTSAIYSGSCSDRMICEVGAFARGNADQLAGLIKLVESYIPDSYHSYLDILKTSAQGSFDCNQKYQCGSAQQQQGQPGNQSPTQAPFLVNQQQQTPRPQLHDLFETNVTSNEIKQDAPRIKPGKFRRHI